MEKGKIFFEPNSSAKKYCSRRFLKRAWDKFYIRQCKDETRYTKAILKLNEYNFLFRNIDTQARKRKTWGKQVKDFVYGYWKEEDVRFKLAAEMYAFPDSQIVSQVHIKQRGRLKKKSKYPDLFFILFRYRKTKYLVSEENKESTAIEIKYFGQGSKSRDVKNKVTEDLNKLIIYQSQLSKPKADCGYFFCIDESGNAEPVLKELFSKRKYKKTHPLGYGVLIPRYTKIGIAYPKCFEGYSKKNRKIAYLLGYIKGKIINPYYSSKSFFSEIKEEGDKSGCYCLFKGGVRGWLGIHSGEYFKGINKKHKGINKKHYVACLKLNKPFDKILNRTSLKQYKEEQSPHKFIRIQEKKNTVLIDEIKQTDLSTLRCIEKCGSRISTKIKRLLSRCGII